MEKFRRPDTPEDRKSPREKRTPKRRQSPDGKHRHREDRKSQRESRSPHGRKTPKDDRKSSRDRHSPRDRRSPDGKRSHREDRKSPEKKLQFDLDDDRDYRARHRESPEKDKEDEVEESIVDRQLRKLNEERRKHLMKKEQISKNIESKTRELDFIRGLDSDDVIYMMYKKDLYAARIIQRWWRVRKMRKIFSKETSEKIKMIKAAMMVQKAWRLRKRRKFLSHYQKARVKRVDHFYDPISDEKLKEYEDKVKSRVRTFTIAELGEKTEEQLEREYITKYRGFYDNYIDNELTRRKANWLWHQIDDMLQFLSDDGKVKNLRIWGYDGSTPNLYLEARKLNEKKIETALSGRLFLHEDDDLDIEGDRLLREIRAYKEEMVHNHFY